MEHIEIGFSGRLLVHNTELDDQLTVQQGISLQSYSELIVLTT